MQEIIQKDKCTGCSACYSICPVNAISMRMDKEGFLYPVIDQEVCTDCGLCKKTCSVLNKKQNFNHKMPKLYGGWIQDSEIREKSSSGGVFSLLAEVILDKGGFVCGAAFDENLVLKHIIISDEKELEKLRGSKYVQSEIGNVLKDIKKLLDSGKQMLFSGTPCQVAGLKSYLNREYDNLLTVDLICHGVPSPLVFEEYIKELAKKYDVERGQLGGFNFRDKMFGWDSPSYKLTRTDDSFVYASPIATDKYSEGFLSNLYLRPMCTRCPFASLPRVADITLGDFWGVVNYRSELDDQRGTSAILVNNEKGAFYLKNIENKMVKIVPASFEFAVQNNNCILFPAHKHVNRDEFFEEFSQKEFDLTVLIDKYLDKNNYGVKKNKSVGILNMQFSVENFGAVLVGYSLQKVIDNLGYNAKLVNYISIPRQNWREKICSLSFYKFRENFMKRTKTCVSDEDLYKLNNQFDTFVAGSDQIWRMWHNQGTANKYFLGWVHPSKHIVSYAPSFAEAEWGAEEEVTEFVKPLLKKYAAISVREKQGVEILKNTFGINATQVLDPTLLLTDDDYNELIEHENIERRDADFISCYFLADSENQMMNNQKLIDIANEANCDLVNIKGYWDSIVGVDSFIYRAIPKWLQLIRDSKFVITDSYHGVLFSIIFKKQFVFIERKCAGNNRLESLFSMFDIRNRFFSSIDEVDMDKIKSIPIDYEKLYKQLNIEKEKSLKFLKTALKGK